MLTNISTQKIDGLVLETYGLISASFLLQSSLRRVWFFKKIFLLTDNSMEIVLEMFFLVFSNIDVEFTGLEKLTWRSYTTAEALSTNNRVKPIDKTEFAKAILDKNLETFIMNVSVLEAITIHLF